jgi:alanyl-tRNA synthetase
VEKAWLPRDLAEKQHGFRLYQGGVPPGKKVRVVNIKGFDVEACAGTHLDNTREIGMIKILRSERIQDGVERLEFSVGLAAVKQNQERDKLLTDTSSIYNVMPEQLPKTAQRIFTEWKSQRKEIQELHTQSQASATGTSTGVEETIKGVKIITRTITQPLKGLIAVARKITNTSAKTVVILGTLEEGVGKIIVARTKDIDLDIKGLMKTPAELLGGGSGGKPDFGQAGGPKGDKLKDAMVEVQKEIKKELKDKKE